MNEVRVPFLDLRRSVCSMRDELEAGIASVLDAGRFVLEEQVACFEAEFAAYCGASHAIGVGSGTDAITIALRAAGVREGDEVVVAANVCVPTVAAIQATGAAPVLADAEPTSFGLDPEQLEQAVTVRTRAVVVVHLYGQVGDMGALLEAAERHELTVVEDAAHAHGATYLGKRAGTIGHVGAFSFYPSKNLGALGDGGAVVTNDDEIAERSSRLRSHGIDKRDRATMRSTNSRLDAIQAAILRRKLPHLDRWNELRRLLAKRYLAQLPTTGALALPEKRPGRRHVYHQFVVRSRSRQRLREELLRKGVETAVHYPLPIHHHPAYADLRRSGALPVSEELAATVVSLPLYPELTDDEQELVIDAVIAATRGSRRQPRSLTA
jgi:dTDP-3-amino-3,4,6-trideoxy-alpha-D-glucose transaminase